MSLWVCFLLLNNGKKYKKRLMVFHGCKMNQLSCQNRHDQPQQGLLHKSVTSPHGQQVGTVVLEKHRTMLFYTETESNYFLLYSCLFCFSVFFWASIWKFVFLRNGPEMAAHSFRETKLYNSVPTNDTKNGFYISECCFFYSLQRNQG